MVGIARQRLAGTSVVAGRSRTSDCVLRLAGCRGLHACRIAEGSNPGRHITGNHAAGADQRIITDRNARQDDRSCSDPDVAPDADRAAKLEAGGSLRLVAWMVGS